MTDRTIMIELIRGVEGDCIAINDFRVSGNKPWGGGKIIQTWFAKKSDILHALELETDKEGMK